MSLYSIWVTPPALREIKDLPGHVRQRARRAIDELRKNPRPPGSKALDLRDLDVEVRRLRIEKWRVVYAIAETGKTVDVLAARKRPPYDYGDLAELLARTE